jgi:hypothetical protein
MPTSNPTLPHQTNPNSQLEPSQFPFEDFLTPEYSSENFVSDASTHTTPGIDELQWRHNYSGPALHQALNNIGPGDHTARLFDGDETNDLQGITSPPIEYFSRTISGSQLLSPQLTTTPSPPEPANLDLGHLSGRADNNLATPASTTMFKRKWNPDFRHLQMSPDRYGSGRPNQASLEPSPIEPNACAVSPVVMVSSYTRGDSPARSSIPLSRTVSKRSQGSRSSDLLAPHMSNVSNEDAESSRLRLNLATSAQRIDDSDRDLGLDRAGLDPRQRGNEFVPSLEDIEESRRRQEKNADIESWLAKSETGSQVDEEEPLRGLGRQKSHEGRLGSRSTGAPVDTLSNPSFDDAHTPGPEVLIAEESDVDESDEQSQSDMSKSRSPSSAAGVDTKVPLTEPEDIPPIGEIPEEQEPLPHQFYRRTPWQDPPRFAGLSESQDQPTSSNAAIFRFDQQAAKFETASRAATWGTRRLSEAEVSSIVEGSKIRHLSLSKGRERGVSFISKLLPRRTPSVSKQKNADTAAHDPPSNAAHKKHGESLSSTAPVQRMTSVGKSRSPVRTALMAITGHLTAGGRSTSAIPETASPSSPFHMLKRNRSKSELPRSAGRGDATPDLAELMTQQGGPPMLSLASPMQDRRVSGQTRAPRTSEDDDEEEDDEEDELISDQGISMDFNVHVDNINPTLDGFMAHARQLNPTLAPFLIERIGNEQLRRYKKLVDNKIKHTQAVVVHKKCPSGKHCFELNGEATLLPPRTNAKDPEVTYAQFQITGRGDTDEDGPAFAEGVVTPALFPSGIPLPPVKQLPAEFECPLCFKVKKFQKPSDWTKHVHEDVQPFSCTFQNCTDPKSFKRKADWVRHENERHRHLEWWQCNFHECSHICYRKDNFVQHLVREHKLPEPKVRRGSGSTKSRPVDGNYWRGDEVDEVWRLLHECHRTTQNKPRDEICKFCGNMCNTWKKVSSHLGKHMEQIALPVLQLVQQREVSPDTIVSPIEQSYQSHTPMMAVHTSMVYGDNQGNLSPYPLSATSLYQGSSAGQSPASMHTYPQAPPVQYVAAYQSGGGSQPQMQAHTAEIAEFAAMRGSPTTMTYASFATVSQTNSFVPINAAATYPPAYPTVRRSSLQAQPQAQIPRSQPVQHDMQTIQLTTDPEAMYHAQQGQPMYSSPVDTERYITHYGQSLAQHHNMTAGTSQMGTAAPRMSSEELYDAQRLGDYPMPGQQNVGHGYQY